MNNFWVPTTTTPVRRDLKNTIGEGDVYNKIYKEINDHLEFDSHGCIYEVGNVMVRPGDICVDAGANIGLWSMRAVKQGASQVFSFEPTLKSFQCLCLNVADMPMVHPFCMALSGTRHMVYVPVNQDGDSAGSRLDNLEYRGYIKTPDLNLIYVTTLDELFDVGMFHKIDHLKLDVEGAERQILYGLSKERLRLVGKIVMEYHRDERLKCEYHDMIMYLRQSGFNHRFTLTTPAAEIITFER
jgi:FkbM family methyltransferase